MAYFSPDLRNTSEERRHRIQGYARADAAFFAAIRAGHLCTSDYAGQARCASGCGVANVPSWVGQRSGFRLGGEPNLTQSTGEKSQGGGQMGPKDVSFCTPLCFFGIPVKFLFENGRPVGARTRDLYRVKPRGLPKYAEVHILY